MTKFKRSSSIDDYSNSVINTREKSERIPLSSGTCNSYGGSIVKFGHKAELFCVLSKKHDGLHSAAPFGQIKTWADTFNLESFYHKVDNNHFITVTDNDYVALNNKLHPNVIVLASKPMRLWRRLTLFIKRLLKR